MSLTSPKRSKNGNPRRKRAAHACGLNFHLMYKLDLGTVAGVCLPSGLYVFMYACVHTYTHRVLDAKGATIMCVIIDLIS